jgi:transcriptional regulator GlxA family with amidase domain
MIPIENGNDALRLLLDYLRLIRTGGVSHQAAVQQAIVSHVHDLAALVLGTNRKVQHQGKSGVAAARLAAVVDHIAKSFTEPDLSLAGAADRLNISPRYLQELLERSGATFTARVNELRLKRAFALLTKFPHRPVSEIAAQAGFANVSHFNRLFRQRFGDTPSGVRGGN